MKLKKSTAFRALFVTILALASTITFAQSNYGSYKDTGGGIVSNQPWCNEASQGAGSYGCGHMLLKVTAPQSALSTITTAQTLDSYVLPAALLNNVNRALRVCFNGVYTSPGTTTPTITIALKIGSSVTPISLTSAGISSTASTNMPFSGCYVVNTSLIGTSGTDEAHGVLNVNISANTPAAAIASYLDTNTAASSTYDHTVSNTAVLSIAASSTVTAATLRQATWELMRNQ